MYLYTYMTLGTKEDSNFEPFSPRCRLFSESFNFFRPSANGGAAMGPLQLQCPCSALQYTLDITTYLQARKKRSLYAKCHYIRSTHILALCKCGCSVLCMFYMCMFYMCMFYMCMFYMCDMTCHTCPCTCARCCLPTRYAGMFFTGACFVTCLLGTSRLMHRAFLFNGDFKTVKLECLSLYSQ